MPQLYEKLTRLGLSENEAQVYLSALELGESSVQNVANKSHMNRVTVHKILERLTQQGLVFETKKGKKRYVATQAPKKLIDNIHEQQFKLEQKAAELIELLPELAAIYNYSSVKPRIRFYENLEGLKTVYLDTLINNDHIYAFLSVATIDNRLLQWIRREYILQRKKKGITAKVLVPADEHGKAYQRQDKERLRESRLLPPDKFPFSIEVNIYNNRVALISNTTKEFFGVIIQSEEVYKTFKLIFNLSWQAAKAYSGE